MSKEAIQHYESALKEAFPSGAAGDVFFHWNEARKALAEQPAQQEPVAYWIPKAEQFCIANPSGRPFAKAWEPLYTSQQPPAQRKPLTDEQREKLRDAFAQSLTSVYVCGRVWGAWQYGTMSEDDFQPASECEEVLDSLVEAANNIKEQP